MFEQSVVTIGNRKPWTLAVSVTMQTAIVSVAILVSVLHTESLNFTPLRNAVPIANVPMIEKHAEANTPPGPTTNSSVRMPARPFVEPSKIPSQIAVIDDVGSPPQIVGSASSFSDGIPGGIGIGETGIGGARIAPPTPPPAVVQKPDISGPIRVASGVQAALLINRVMPLYPPIARSMRISGTVHLVGVIAKDGTIQKLEVIDGHPFLVRAALEAVTQWVYHPTLLNGQPVEVIAPIEVHFTLSQ